MVSVVTWVGIGGWIGKGKGPTRALCWTLSWTMGLIWSCRSRAVDIELGENGF